MKNKNFQNAFSLMEMMVVLLIVAIIAAATAPMVTKKMMRTAGSGDSPWVFTGLNNNIAYNMAGSDNTTAIIGATSLPSGWNQHTRLFIDSGDNASHIAFGNGNAVPLLLTADPDNGRIGFSNATIPDESVAFGTSQTLNDSNLVAMGTGVTCGSEATAVGHTANASGQKGVAIGTNASSTSSGAIAIGNDASATGSNSIAIGNDASATGSNSIAIGAGTNVTVSNQIVLGTNNDVVYIPGRLVVGRTAVLGYSNNALEDSSTVAVIRSNRGGRMEILQRDGSGDYDAVYANGRVDYSWAENTITTLSDRRLKNVGEKYTAGLEELKKLDFYHYTFKADKDNTPLVGVMAQDLQKVFPDAVTKGEDGYLRIRLEDMFYAVINAVKELDSKVSQIVADITGISSKVDEQQKVIEAQQQKIDELEKANADFEKRLAKLEKKNKKFEE